MATSPAPVRTILLATDFSPTAGAAALWAASLARMHAAQVVLVHAMTPPIPPAGSPDFIALPPDYERHFRDAASRRLEEEREKLVGLGLDTHAELTVGPASSSILDIAKRSGADLIVVGTRGLTGFKHLLLGSTAERVVQGAQVPVLTVHPNDEDGNRPIRTVLVPTDFSEDAKLAIATAMRVLLVAGSDARLLLLHAYHLPVEFTALGTMPVTPTLFADAADQARKRLDEVAAPLRASGLRVDTIALEGYAPALVEEVAKREHVDLVAMGTHGRSGLKRVLLGSTAERVVQHSPCPVLTVRRPD